MVPQAYVGQNSYYSHFPFSEINRLLDQQFEESWNEKVLESW